MRRTVLATVAAALGVVPLAACGSDHAGATTAPTTLAAAPVTARANVFKPMDHGGGDDGGMEGEGHVSSIVAGTACPTLAFMVGTVKVTLTAATMFEGGTCASIKNGSDVDVQGTRQADGSIVASKVEFGDDGGNQGPNPNNPVAGESRVTSIVAGTSCPTLSIMMGTIKVTLTATTVFERGTCADIKVGSKLRVRGTTQADGSVVATDVEVEAEEQGENEPVEGEDVITAIKAGTSCPNLTFMIGVKAISVTAVTDIHPGTCADLVVGARVHVQGTMTGDNIVATRIEIKDHQGHPVAEGDGRVTSLVAGSSCPALQFIAEGEWTVTLDATTSFVGGTCADIAVGRKVGVKGIVTAEHQVLGQQIVFKGPGN
jgi:hypothetical protein